MKYIFRIKRFPAFIEETLPRLLPERMTYKADDRKAFIALETATQLSEDLSLSLVRRECDRIGFLSGSFVNPVLSAIERGVNTITGIATARADVLVMVPPDPSATAQKWDTRLPLQLRLWRLAKEESRSPWSRIMLLFQIAELVMPTNDQKYFPPYSHPSRTPHPHTEAKLLRDLVSHQKPVIRNSQLRAYCKWLGLPPKFADPNDATTWRVISGRVPVVEKLARSVINQRISRRKRKPLKKRPSG